MSSSTWEPYSASSAGNNGANANSNAAGTAQPVVAHSNGPTTAINHTSLSEPPRVSSAIHPPSSAAYQPATGAPYLHHSPYSHSLPLPPNPYPPPSAVATPVIHPYPPTAAGSAPVAFTHHSGNPPPSLPHPHYSAPPPYAAPVHGHPPISPTHTTSPHHQGPPVPGGVIHSTSHATGAPISYNVKPPPSSVPPSVVPHPGVGPVPQTPVGPPAGGNPFNTSGPEFDLPPELVTLGWRKFWSKRENRWYFWNCNSGESLWELPPLPGRHPPPPGHPGVNYINYTFIVLYFQIFGLLQYDTVTDPLGISCNGPAHLAGIKRRSSSGEHLTAPIKKFILA